MSQSRSWTVPVVVGLFGLGLGVVTPVPIGTLVQTLVLAQVVLLVPVLAVALRSSTPGASDRPSWGLDSGAPVRRTVAAFGGSILVTLALFGIPYSPSPPLRGLAAGVALGLGAWSFVALYETVAETTASPDPGADLDRLADRVDLEQFVASGRSHGENGGASPTPLLALLQVAQRSLDRCEYGRALQAVNALETGTDRLLVEYAASDGVDPDAIRRAFDYWDRVGRAAVDDAPREVSRDVVDAVANLARTALRVDRPEAFGVAVGTLVRFCERAIDRDRLDRHDVETVGDLLVAAVDAEDDEALSMALDHVSALRESMQTVDPRVAPPLAVLAIGMLRAQRRLVEAHPETMDQERHARAYARLEAAADECVADLLVTDADVSAVGAAFAAVGVAASESDHQWIVRRIAMRVIDLRAAAEGRYDDADDHVETLHHAGGEDGVETAFDHVRQTYGDGPAPSVDDPVSRLG